jgi:hypothetical protein
MCEFPGSTKTGPGAVILIIIPVRSITGANKIINTNEAMMSINLFVKSYNI